MKVSKFSNDLQSASIHTNDMAEQPGQIKSFNERQGIDAARSVIGAYNKSKLGQPVGEYVRPRPSFDRPSARSAPAADTQQSRQSINASPQVPQRTFTEPPARGYNPYR